MRQVLAMCVMALMSMTCLVQAQVQGYKWVDTFTFSGNGHIQTAPFRLWSEEWKVKYRPNGNVPFEIQLINAENDTIEPIVHQPSGGTRSGAHSGEGSMQWAYLIIRGTVKNGISKPWSTSVLQYMDKSDEWNFRKWKPVETQLKPYGSWSGKAGEKVWSLEMPTAWGRMTFKQFGAGRLSVDVLKDDAPVAHLVMTKAGECYTWLYRQGVYSIRVSAIDTDWSLDVETFVK